jgi:hypothetical protein
MESVCRTYEITPLQVAVHSWDYYATRVLLEAGADPNGIGVVGGKRAPFYVAPIDNCWTLASPLHIIRHAGFAFEEFDYKIRLKEVRESRLSYLEALLKSYGAVDFISPQSE